MNAIVQPTVLVVDDDSDLRVSLCEALDGEGYRTIDAGDGRDALDRMRGDRPDLIVLDLVMPVMDGWQFRKAQLGDPDLAKIPVVVLTALNNSERSQIDASALLFKPVTLEVFLDVISRHASIR